MVSENARKQDLFGSFFLLRVAGVQPKAINQSTEHKTDEVWLRVEAEKSASYIT
jgi:hypothetical protein